MTNILFVCTGNTCRSPMAEAIGKAELPNAIIQSAGLYPGGDRASRNAVLAMAERGLDISNHQPQGMSEALYRWADVILTMGIAHKEMIDARFGSGKAHTIISYVTGVPGDVADPYGGSLSVYRQTAEQLEGLIRHLTKEGADGR